MTYNQLLVDCARLGEKVIVINRKIALCGVKEKKVSHVLCHMRIDLGGKLCAESGEGMLSVQRKG